MRRLDTGAPSLYSGGGELGACLAEAIAAGFWFWDRCTRGVSVGFRFPAPAGGAAALRDRPGSGTAPRRLPRIALARHSGDLRLRSPSSAPAWLATPRQRGCVDAGIVLIGSEYVTVAMSSRPYSAASRAGWE